MGRTVTLPVGNRLGHYRVLRELGRGGMGRVYLAHDEVLGRDVALKVLADAIAADPDALRRFAEEARHLAAMSHPNIATIHSLEDADGVRFLTMERVEGETLAERLARGPLPEDEAVGVARQIARALEAAHSKGVIHRDLKPRNVRIAPGGLVKVLDFGLAVRVDDAESGSGDSTLRDTTRREGFAGTPGYMSPEQLRGRPADSRADLWALGCVLYECLTGRPAFPGETAPDRIARTLTSEPDWDALPEGTGSRVRSVLRRCLEPVAELRESDAERVRRDLDEDLARRSAGAAAPADAAAAPGATSLPRRRDRFVGRERDLEEVARGLEEHALVTLTGPGGSGKSRLALEVAARSADRFRDGARLVELAPVRDPDRIDAAVLRALGLREKPDRPARELLHDALRDAEALLVLDNFEQLLPAGASFVEELLQACGGLRVIATSREPLRVEGEAVHKVPSLDTPASAEATAQELRGVESVELFVDRARAARPEFVLDDRHAAAVSEICRRLDGIPLALELAAARVRVLPVEEIARRLDDRFHLLTEGRHSSLPKHRTLRALVDWSHDLLDPPGRILLRRLSVFCGGWTLDAAEHVGADDGIPVWDVVDLHSSLVDKSLVEMVSDFADAEEPVRYRMLETIREYARERLEAADEARAARRRHRDFFLRLAEEAAPRLRGTEQTAWLARLGREHENLGAAFETCLEPGEDPVLALRLAGALGRYWMVRGHWSEGRRWCDAALARDASREPREARADALNAAGNMAFHRGEYDTAHARHTEALEIRRRLDDAHGQAMSLNNLGEVARLRGCPEAAADLYRRAADIQRAIGDRWGLAVALNNLGEVAQGRAQYDVARAYHEEALALWPSIGDRWGMAWTQINLGIVEEGCGRLEEARRHFERSLALGREIGDRFGIALSLAALGRLAEKRGEWTVAAGLHAQGLVLRKELGDREGIAESLEAFAALAAADGDAPRAARLLGAAGATRDDICAPAPATRQRELVRLAASLRRGLGRERFAGERDAGRALPEDEAMELALRDAPRVEAG